MPPKRRRRGSSLGTAASTRSTTNQTRLSDTGTNPTEVARLKRRMIEKVLSHKRRDGNDAFNLDQLVSGWLELESDPGTFSLLIEDFGCFGAQVDEVYDLDQKFEGPVYGFIFLFKWLNNHQSESSLRNQSKAYNDLRSDNNASASTSTTKTTNATNSNRINTRSANCLSSIDSSNDDGSQQQTSDNSQRQPNQDGDKPQAWSYVVDENIISEMFFAKQMISNSCATHALISVLLNCDRNELTLGPTLTRLKEHTKIMNPENKGYAIGNLPELAKAHNSHASYSSLYCRDRPKQRGVSFVIRGNQRTNLQQLQNQPETYHFVSYMPINNHLYELDGLKNYPIDHGPINPNEDWTEKFRSVIKQRLLENKSGSDDPMNEIRYNLMAVVPDKRLQLKAQHKRYERYLKSTLQSLKQLSSNADTLKTFGGINRSTSTKESATTEGLNDISSRPFSPVSNITLTASETGSLCNSPKHSCEGEVPPSSGDIEIPNPPYSPLSNDTLSASETGSNPNSPSRFDDSFLFDDQAKIEKYSFVKFDPSSKFAHEKESPMIANTTNNMTTTTSTTAATTTMESSTTSDANTNQESTNLRLYAYEDMQKLSKQIQRDIAKNESLLKEEYEKRCKYKIDNSRRTHNYEPFIMTFLSLLAKQGQLADLIEKDLGLLKEQALPGR